MCDNEAEKEGEKAIERPPNKDEIKKALRNTENGKAPGSDNIPPELLQEDTDLTAHRLSNLFESSWKQEQVPEEWRTCLLFKLPKKGNVLNCSNWRGITVLSVISKIFSRIIHDRIKNGTETKLRESKQALRATGHVLINLVQLQCPLQDLFSHRHSRAKLYTNATGHRGYATRF
jgi:sorting nexin-29